MDHEVIVLLYWSYINSLTKKYISKFPPVHQFSMQDENRLKSHVYSVFLIQQKFHVIIAAIKIIMCLVNLIDYIKFCQGQHYYDG